MMSMKPLELGVDTCNARHTFHRRCLVSLPSLSSPTTI
jgi:hypothetical protein